MGTDLLEGQLYQMAAALIAGMAGGACFCLYQYLVFGRHKGRKKVLRRKYMLKDGLFGIGLLVLWLIFWFGFTDGSLRAAVFIWLALGFAIFILLIYPNWLKLWHILPHPDKRLIRKKETKATRKLPVDKLLNGGAAAYLKFNGEIRNKSISLKEFLARKLPHRHSSADSEDDNK